MRHLGQFKQGCHETHAEAAIYLERTMQLEAKWASERQHMVCM